MKVTKMQGLGNDYLCFRAEPPEDVRDLAVRLLDRHTGIGADGLIFICSSQTADFRMRIFNADGSEAEMCGNGIRCLAKYVYEKGLTEKTVLEIETGAGHRTVSLEVSDGIVRSVTVDMGEALISEPAETEVGGIRMKLIPVSTGNPHAVFFTDENGLKLPEQIGGPVKHPLFPEGVNLEFVRVISPEYIRVRVIERGVGVTKACGTGACASFAAAAACGLCQPEGPVTAELDGGILEISADKNRRIRMTGPAEFVFDAEIQMNGISENE